MKLHWLFCKNVPYEEIRREVASVCDGDQATQMWNGMQYVHVHTFDLYLC